MGAKIGVISFPGSNGDQDSLHAVTANMGMPGRMIDYRESDLSEFSAIILPGGFSYGDHLRCGAIARFAPVMQPLRAFAQAGGPILGICNGFQILAEAHLLPGALLRNRSLSFQCQWLNIRIENAKTAWTNELNENDVLRLPIANGEGCYFAARQDIDKLEQNGQIIARYCDEAGNVTSSSNPNGSAGNIAAVSNPAGNVVGLMPHPERAADELIGGADGLKLLNSVLSYLSVPI
jgi:phosphoribosylformylglycinamidine synthase subunit PurQ / glutaminase